MGLCKCRAITSMFCFEHRKNVCDRCVISDHQCCPVRTYLQWLQDSNYDYNCALCCKTLKGEPEQIVEPIIRLSCFDLFHTKCVLEYFHNSTKDIKDKMEAVKMLSCPLCKVPVIPADLQLTPLVEQIRNALIHSEWRPMVESLLPLVAPSLKKPSLPHDDRDQLFSGSKLPGNRVQPNRADRLAIDIGLPDKRYLEDDLKGRAEWFSSMAQRMKSLLYQSDEPVHPKALQRFGRVMLNFVSLRNVRCLSRGFSPRQVMVLLVSAAILFAIIYFVFPATTI